jgi:DNA-binding CsgD family transcriptional regulator
MAAGFASLFTEKVKHENPYLALIDDGFRFLYVLTIEKSHPEDSYPYNDPVYYFLNHLTMIIPRRSTSINIRDVWSDTDHGINKKNRLSRAEMAVVMDLARGISPGISQSRRRLTYKAWYNHKNSGFRRLGIKNTLSLVRAADVWKRRGHKTVCGEGYSFSASE